MCGRYTLFGDHDYLKRFKAAMSVKPNYNVSPGQQMPIIYDDGTQRVVALMKWGLVPAWAKETGIGYKMINARAESLFEKATWKGPIRHHRCLIPASGFYEWHVTDTDTKQPYFIRPKDTDLFAFAGIFELNTIATKMDIWSYSIITTEPNKEMSAIHHRMPVILRPDEEDAWLWPDLPDNGIESLLHPYHDDGLEIHKVSSDVNSVKVNDKHLVYALD